MFLHILSCDPIFHDLHSAIKRVRYKTSIFCTFLRVFCRRFLYCFFENNRHQEWNSRTKKSNQKDKPMNRNNCCTGTNKCCNINQDKLFPHIIILKKKINLTRKISDIRRFPANLSYLHAIYIALQTVHLLRCITIHHNSHPYTSRRIN